MSTHWGNPGDQSDPPSSTLQNYKNDRSLSITSSTQFPPIPSASAGMSRLFPDRAAPAEEPAGAGSFSARRSSANTQASYRASSASTTRRGRNFQSSRSSHASSQGFAPGLALKKKAVDPYDPEGMLKPKDEYSLLREKQDATLRGTWTTIDPDNNVRGFDEQWQEERRQQGSSMASAMSISSGPMTLDPGKPWSITSSVSGLGAGMRAEGNDSTASLDERFENPDIDVDPEVREKFRPIDEVLEERAAPRSAFEQRNQHLGVTKVAANVMKVVIGGKVVKTMEQKGDMRGQYQDRFGNYIGKNLGQMKKHLVEDRQSLIQLRDQEMIRATQEKRAWDAMDPDERERHMAKRPAPLSTFLLGPGAMESDVFEYAEIPEIYTKRVSAASIAAWSARSASQSKKSETSDDLILFQSDVDSIDTPLNTSGAAGQSMEVISTGRSGSDRLSSTVKAVGNHTEIQQSQSSTAKSRHFSGSVLSIRSTSVLANDTPELACVADITVDRRPEYDRHKAVLYDKARLLCSTRGRVVTVTLHNPVVFSPSAIASRVFGGVLQEIQYHPRERLALVVFLFPSEAYSFVKHATTAREKDVQAYRQLQLDVEWYRGDETKAIVPLQKGVYMKVIGEEATRVIKISGIPLTKKKEELAQDLKDRLGKILVNVALVRDSRRHVREKMGNSAIIEFVSISDAYEALLRFKAGDVLSYCDKDASWLRDPCDRPPVHSRACACVHCLAEK